MPTFSRSLFLLALPALLLLSACEPAPPKVVLVPPTPGPTPRLGPPPQRTSDAERLVADEAMTIEDVFQLLQNGSTEDQVIAHVARRGFLEAPAAERIKALTAQGVSARLLVIVQDPEYVLTPAEKQQYVARQARRAAGGKGPLKTQDLARDEARHAAAAKKRLLEDEVKRLEAQREEFRRNGAREADLEGLTRRLNTAREQLTKLSAP